MKIYTKRGDAGETDLFGSGRVKKHDLRVEAYGMVDECNATIGFARALMQNQARLEEIDLILKRLQEELFCLGSELAAPAMIDKMPTLKNEHIVKLEQEIDQIQLQLKPLKHFILPSGSQSASALHLARAISRRVERLIVALAEKDPIRSELLIYTNRLSDHLFVLARFANHLEGVNETIWEGRKA